MRGFFAVVSVPLGLVAFLLAFPNLNCGGGNSGPKGDRHGEDTPLEYTDVHGNIVHDVLA